MPCMTRSTPQTGQGWEEEFDKNFTVRHASGSVDWLEFKGWNHPNTVKEVKDFIRQTVAKRDEERKDILEQYKDWAKSHNPTWETDNLVGNILGWPSDYKGLHKRK